MSEKQSAKTDILGIVTFGLFLIIVAVIFMSTPDLLDRIIDFFRDFTLQQLAPYIYLPAPKSDHPTLYTAVFQFCLAFATIHIPILGARFLLKESVNRKAETISSILFWFGAAWIINLLLTIDIAWYTFLGYLIALIGVSIVTRSIIILIALTLHKQAS